MLSITTMHARIGWQNLRTTEFLDDGNYLLITGTDFVDGKINFARCYYVEQERYNQDRNIQIKNGCILITKDGTLGKVAYVKGLNKPATLNAGIFNVEIRDSNQVDRIYLYQYIKAPFLLEYVNHMATGGTIKHLNQNILVDFLVSMPQSIEQKKIGGLFQLLDHLITLHQSKCFESFFVDVACHTLSWEQRKLGEVAAFSKGSGYSKSDLKDSGVPVILYGRLYTNYETVIKEVDTFIDSIGGAVYSKGGEIITPSSGETSEDISIASVVEKSGILLGGDLNIIYPQNFLDSIFIAISISNGKPHKDMAKRAQGKSVVHLHNGDLAQIEIDYPSIDEQTRISSYFQSLDHLITLHQLEPYYLISKAIAYRIIDYAEYKLLM